MGRELKVYRFTAHLGEDPAALAVAAAAGVLAEQAEADEVPTALSAFAKDAAQLDALAEALLESSGLANGPTDNTLTVQIRQVLGRHKDESAKAAAKAYPNDLEAQALEAQRQIIARALVSVGDQVVGPDRPALDLWDDLLGTERTFVLAAYQAVNEVPAEHLTPFVLSQRAA